MVAQSNQTASCVDSAPLGFEDFEDARAFNTQAKVSFCCFLSLAGLIDLNQEKALLLAKGLVHLKRGFYFPECLQGILNVSVNGCLVEFKSGPGGSARGSALIDCLGDG